MTQEDRAAVDIEGLPVDEAAAAVVDADPDRDPERVRAALDHVAADGVVSADAAADAVAHVATVVSTPETRVELAADALADAREAAESVADFDLVAARLDEFEARLDALEDRLDELADRLDDVVDARKDGDLSAVATGVEALTAEANATASAADELAADVEAFETWVTDPDTRYDRLADDADAVAETLDTLESSADRIADAGDEAESGDGSGGTVTLPGGETADPAVAWFDLVVRQWMIELYAADLQAETETLAAWADREGVQPPPAALTDRVDALDERREALGDRTDALARPGWTAQFSDRLNAVASEFADLETPIDWVEVEAILDEFLTEPS